MTSFIPKLFISIHKTHVYTIAKLNGMIYNIKLVSEKHAKKVSMMSMSS